MENIRKINILVLGNSGAGKSTLIHAISGTKINMHITQSIEVYESFTWPICFIEKKGVEYRKGEGLKSIRQVMRYTKKRAAKWRSGGIDVIWYCIEGTTKGALFYHMEQMKKAVEMWKNVPIFVVITKSYSQADMKENVKELSRASFKKTNRNLQKIFPVVAEPYIINDDTVVEPKGLSELCIATLACSEQAKLIGEENRKRMILEQKRFTANALKTRMAAAGILVGADPISFADSQTLVPLETSLARGILKVYNVNYTGAFVESIMGSAAIMNAAKEALESLKTIPNIAGSVLNAVVAGFFTTALGEAVIAWAEEIYFEKTHMEKTDVVVDYLAEKMRGNAVLGYAVRYIQNNSENLQGKFATEIFIMIDDSIRESTRSI